jgi:hypothetical protein
MINYAKHDEEFYGVIKLTTGEEILAKAVLTEDEGDTIIFLSDPVLLEIFTKELQDGKVAKGLGFSGWMQMSDEEFFIVHEKNVIAIATMSKETVIMYENYINGLSPKDLSKSKVSLDQGMGYRGNINDARRLFEKIYKTPLQP